MTKPKEIGPLSSVKFIRYALAAHSGFGKTVQAGTAPNALFLTTDPEGTASAARFGSSAEEWKINQWEDLDRAYLYLRDEGIKSEGYRWIIIDNGTECQNLAMKKSIDRRMKLRPDTERFVPEQKDYQVSQNAIIDFVKKMHTLPVHIMWTFHLKGTEDGNGDPFYSIAIQGQKDQVAQQVLGYTNIIGMGQVFEHNVGGKVRTVRRTWFTHSGAYRGKDRFVALGRYQDSLTIPKMTRIIRESRINSRKPRSER